MNDIAEKVGLLSFAKFACPHVRKHFLLKEFFGITDTSVAGGSNGSATLSNVIQRNLFIVSGNSASVRFDPGSQRTLPEMVSTIPSSLNLESRNRCALKCLGLQQNQELGR